MGVSSQFLIQCPFGSLKSVMVGIFTPRKLAKAVNKVFFSWRAGYIFTGTPLDLTAQKRNWRQRAKVTCPRSYNQLWLGSWYQSGHHHAYVSSLFLLEAAEPISI